MEDFYKDIKPVEIARPKGARQIEAFSPKLGRRLRFYNWSTFRLWLLLEADPGVRMFCERPGYLQTSTSTLLAAFWARYDDRREILLLAPSGDAVEVRCSGAETFLPPTVPVRVVDSTELAAARVWTDNWERMLHLITANKKLLSSTLCDGIVRFVSSTTQLCTIERAFSTGDPILVRAAVFSLLHACGRK